MEVKNKMNPKQDNQTPSKKYFDVARPGKTPANPSSRPVVGGPTVKDFDFANKPADNSISKFGNEPDETVNEGFSPTSKPAEPQKNHIDLDNESSGDDLSQVQSELGQPGEHKGTAFKPDDYETSLPNSEEAEEVEETIDSEPELDQSSSDDDYLAEETNGQQDERQASSSEKDSNRSSKKESKKSEKRQQKFAEKNQKDDRYRSDAPADQPPAQPASSISSGQMVVSQHVGRHATLWAEVFAVLVILLLLAGIINLLLDSGLIALEGIPRTDFFSEN